MKFTGERFVPTEQGRIRLEHHHRYAVVLDYVRNSDVLDLACGEGYGSAMLAGHARTVVGADISEEAINHASSAYQGSNITFVRSDAAQLKFADDSFDVVISFETIEHLAEQEKMLAEIRRVLRAHGILIMSSPNRPIYSEESGESNPYHIKELDFAELDYLLKTQFQSVQYYGQRLLMGSVIQPLKGGQQMYQAWLDDGENLVPQTGDLREPIYFLAIAGAEDALLPAVTPSLIYPAQLDLVKHYVGFAKWAKESNAAVLEKDETILNQIDEIQSRDRRLARLNQLADERGEIINTIDQRSTILTDSLKATGETIGVLNQLLIEREAQISALNEEVLRRGEWALGLLAELNEEREKLLKEWGKFDALINTSSWKLTLPLREFKRWATQPTKQFSKYIRKSLSISKRLYQMMAVDHQKLNHHRHFLAKHAPLLLSLSETRFDEMSASDESSGEAQNAIAPIVFPPPLMPATLEEQLELANSINIQTAAVPLVSVIIPVYGKVEYTLNCLASIAANTPLVPFEIILVDDCSTDGSTAILAGVENIRLVENEKNQGFIRSCNRGAEAANGEYLCFLNNDTRVTKDWLDELFRTFREFPAAGLVGSKLIYPDGLLQEAGGIVWRDGSAWNFGRFQNAELPVYNYAREVDYCSGASIMIPKLIFDEMRGFDEYYLPAYYEDTDLALKIRSHGYRVIYQPLSTVIHYEGITSGKDITKGIKGHQVENAKKFYARWKDRLSSHEIPGVAADEEKDRRALHRVLVLDHCTPTPDKDAGSLIVFNLLLLLREMNFQVTFIPEDNFLYMPEYTSALQRVGVEVLYAPHTTSVSQHLEEFGFRYDLALLFRPSVMERHVEDVRQWCPQAKILYHTQDLHHLRMTREAELFADEHRSAEARKMKWREMAAIERADLSLVVSEVEMELIKQQFAPGKVDVMPLILDTHHTTKAFAERHNIVFVGGFQHPPNTDAVLYFIRDIMPLLRQSLPGVRFYIVGSNCPDEIAVHAAEDIVVTGFVEDLNALLDQMKISVAPLRYGAGIKGKIGSAMAAGLPVVATSLASEGMGLIDEKHLLVANSAEEITAAIVRLYQREDEWIRISGNGLRFADEVWGAETAWDRLTAILGKLGIIVDGHKYSLSTFAPYKLVEPAMLDRTEELSPLKCVTTRQEFELFKHGEQMETIQNVEKSLLELSDDEVFRVAGFCVPCNRQVHFLVDMKSGGQVQGKKYLPNWRERLECPFCKMNNRQRLMTTLIKQSLSGTPNKTVYFMEQVTPIFSWASKFLKEHTIIGSEYLGFEYTSGRLINGIRHEDAENLSFSDNCFDLIVSNDVFEHVPHPEKAFAECARVLKSKGTLLATIPFHSDCNKSITRALLNNGHAQHLRPPVYHGNPLSEDGSLVFTDFGWDILEVMRSGGFSSAEVEIYASREFGHLGGGQIIFNAKK